MLVSLGLIKNSKNEILVCTRNNKNLYNDYWEFPGGKVEDIELPEDALARELKEELGIIPIKYFQIDSVEYDYSDFSVELRPFVINHFLGNIISKEAQILKWVALEKLNELRLLPANKPIVKYLLDN